MKTDILIQTVCISCLEAHSVLEMTDDNFCPTCNRLDLETDGVLLDLLSPRIVVTYPNPLFNEAQPQGSQT